MKAIVTEREISGPAHAIESVRAARMNATAGKTLGTLVGELLGSYLVTNVVDTPAKTSPETPEAHISISFQLQLSDAEFARVENGLKDLVLLRNNLVHHFIDQHDIGTLDGCRGGHDALIPAYTRIDQHVEEVLAWANDMQNLRRASAESVQSDAFRDFVVNGIYPDGTVFWPVAGIVGALREASGELAVEGWTTVETAGRWIVERYPEQKPAKYGCSSWRQVLHDSRLFHLRYFDVGGQRIARYREKERPTTPR
ncbi:MAG: OST-HTH/LOTUS domain-containing protein [Paracoccaceae bacterium]|nr:OST-HTH/LOTUS domain-containing protein [Paracoccaceae bacterium]